MIFSDWRLHRVKTDEATADPDWAGLNDVPVEPVGSAAIVTGAPAVGANGQLAVVGVEVAVLGVTSGRVPVDRASNVCDISFVEVVARTDYDSNQGGVATDAAMVLDTLPIMSVPLNRKVFIELNGAVAFCIRISGNTGISGVDRLQVWIRFVCR